jgi:predicted NUDIX family NTP pyrophosphohydrolase
MAKNIKSAGTLLIKKNPLRVLIVHPSGAYNRNAAWSIPKGKIEKDETIEDAARRETREEVGIESPVDLKSLGDVVYKSGKRVYAYYGEVDESTTPVINWEVDQAEFFALEKAEELLMPAQKPFIQRLKDVLGI